MLGLSLGATSVARGDKVDDLSRTVTVDRDFKVRLTAAVVLGKLRDRRAVPALVRALSDPSEMVRGVAASSLGQIGDRSAVPALGARGRDPSEFVRNRVREALLILRPEMAAPRAPAAAPGRSDKRIYLALGSLQNRSRKGGAKLVARLREVLLKQIGETPAFTLEPRPTGYVVDATIKELKARTTDRWIEMNCEVTFIVGKLPSRAIVGMTAGGATIQSPKLGYRPSFDEQLEGDALENAVLGARPSLLELVAQAQKSAR